jgi:GH25 family lysozyme M1 (1,4-beta-N-acetylmuramidase)
VIKYISYTHNRLNTEEFMDNRFCKKLKKLKAVLMAFVILASLLVPTATVEAAPNEVAQACLGIDVSRYQGKIDWDKVAASGVQFAMIRIGSRTMGTGVLSEDPYAKYNLQEANRVGIKVGAYFFSTAVSDAEVIEEANFTLNIISKYKITFPVAYDCEGYNKTSSRQYILGRDIRTVLAVRFLDTIAAAGYTPMFYASQNSMTGNKDWNMAVLNKYKVWVAQYPSDPFPITASSSYTGAHAMWQYTEKASIAGISGSVDMNVAYFNYDGIAEAKDTSGTPTVTAPTTTTTTATSTTTAASVTFTPVVEVITVNATDVNLRTVPSSTDPTTIVAPINPGDMIFRTGIGDNGWSQVILNGQILYVYSAYVTKVL